MCTYGVPCTLYICIPNAWITNVLAYGLWLWKWQSVCIAARVCLSLRVRVCVCMYVCMFVCLYMWLCMRAYVIHVLCLSVACTKVFAVKFWIFVLSLSFGLSCYLCQINAVCQSICRANSMIFVCSVGSVWFGCCVLHMPCHRRRCRFTHCRCRSRHPIIIINILVFSLAQSKCFDFAHQIFYWLRHLIPENVSHCAIYLIECSFHFTMFINHPVVITRSVYAYHICERIIEPESSMSLIN